MKSLLVGLLLLVIANQAISQESQLEQKVERENIEWCDIRITSASKNDKPRVLLIGDSITKGYYNSVSKQLKKQADCARFATSACVADPAFHKQLEAIISQYRFEIVHFNNGLHGIGYTEEEYRVGYEKALKSIKKQSPSSKLILALSTPLQSISNKNYLNPRIDKRNEIVRELGKKYGAKMNDLHSITKDHPEYYNDPYHYKSEAIFLQAKQVAEKIMAILNSEQKNAPDKK